MACDSHFRKAEIGQFDIALAIDKHVFRFKTSNKKWANKYKNGDGNE